MTRIVALKDKEPLLIKPEEHQGTVAICRCGLSQEWPFCDGSHKQTRDEEAGRVYAYHRDAPGGPLAREAVEVPVRADPRP